MLVVIPVLQTEPVGPGPCLQTRQENLAHKGLVLGGVTHIGIVECGTLGEGPGVLLVVQAGFQGGSVEEEQGGEGEGGTGGEDCHSEEDQ